MILDYLVIEKELKTAIAVNIYKGVCTMLNRIIASLTIIVLLLSANAFADTDLQSPGVWKTGEYVDDFGDPTGKKYVYGGPFYGTFSNSATKKDDLKAYIYYDYNDAISWIELFEYEKWLVNNITSSQRVYEVKIKTDLDHYGITQIFYFIGWMPSGSSRLFVDDTFYNEDYTFQFSSIDLNNVEYNSFVDVLKRSKNFKISVKSTDNLPDSYAFSVPNAVGFPWNDDNIEYSLDKESIYQEAISEQNNGQYKSACTLLLSLDGYKDSASRYSKIKSLKLDNVNLTTGMKIQHKDLGQGTITRLWELSGQLAIDVSFANGTKKSFGFEKSIESGIIKLK